MNHIINKIKNSKTEIEIRIIMKDLGWSSKDSLDNLGWNKKYGYSIWFYRHNWH